MSAEILFAALAARPSGDLVLQGTRQSWCAAELRSAVDDLAGRLADSRVLAVLADNGPAWVIADLAALRAGTVHLPLPDFFSPAQLAHALDASAADTLLTDRPARVEELRLGFAVDGEEYGLVRLRRAVSKVSLPPATAKISFTSGSSGAPKGVCLSSTGLVDTARAIVERLVDLPVGRHLAVLPLALLLENTAGIYAPLLRGGAVCLRALARLGWRGMAGFEPAALQRELVATAPESLILVPELLKAWVMYLAASGQRPHPGLRYVAVGGARVSPALLRRARALGLPAYEGYGLTECGSVVSLNRPGDDGENAGRPLGHLDVRIEGDEVRVGTRAFRGYVGDSSTWPAAGPEQATEFATGDLGNFDDEGHLQLWGRRRNLLITSYGRNIAPEWVESTLLAQPAIAQAVVGGDGRPWLSAVLVGAPGADPAGLAAAVAAANRALPDYARVRRWIAARVASFSVTNGLATGNGRPLRDAIFSHHAADLAALYCTEEVPDVVL